MLFSLVVLLAVLCSIIIESHAVILQSYNHNNKWIGTLRGGARHSKKSSIGRVSSSSKSRRHRDQEDEDEEDLNNDNDDDDDDQEEEEEDYESDRINIRGKRQKGKQQLPTRRGGKSKSSGSSGKKKSNKFQLIPWGSSRNQSNQKKKKGPSLKERLEQLAKQGHTAYNEVYRRAKVLRSSAFEGILLKATWPGNDPVPPELLTEIVKYSIPAFKYSRSDAEDDPYYLTMHKLWTKMSEKDWRTVSKSLYILHCISRDSSTEACSRFAAAIKDLSKTKNPKKPDHKYFDLRQISELDGPSNAYQSFVKSYAAYVLFRSKSFCARFEELRGLSTTTSEKKALAVLLKAQQLIKLGLQAVAPKKPQRNIITGQAMKLISVDLKELWKLYSEKAAILLNSEGSGYQEPKAGNKDVSSVLKFLQEGEGQLKEHLSATAKAFASLKLKLPADLETSTC
eukprot:gene515-556_t